VDPLFYNEGVDPELRELFDFGRPVALPFSQPSSGIDWLIKSAQAQTTMAEITPWLPTRNNIEGYLNRVRQLLADVGGKVIEDKELGEPYREIFQPLLFASAWQETCWRQFTVKDGKQKPLKSSVGAVGIMQVSPRVWRGFYHPNPLNWDITYNATAGAEILHHYLVHYAIRKEEHVKSNGLENLARATYSAYHGGPRHLTRYRKKNTSPKLRRIDEAFWQKYEAVRAGNPLAVKQCYN
jgi:soluble lytic murein transglycosylase-like protein